MVKKSKTIKKESELKITAFNEFTVKSIKSIIALFEAYDSYNRYIAKNNGVCSQVNNIRMAKDLRAFGFKGGDVTTILKELNEIRVCKK